MKKLLVERPYRIDIVKRKSPEKNFLSIMNVLFKFGNIKISDLINELQHIQENEGDLEVYGPGFDGETLTYQYPELVTCIFSDEATKYRLKEGYPSKYVIIYTI